MILAYDHKFTPVGTATLEWVPDLSGSRIRVLNSSTLWHAKQLFGRILVDNIRDRQLPSSKATIIRWDATR